jgi:hypothetical protein
MQNVPNLDPALNERARDQPITVAAFLTLST